ncbi:hypothetical protein VSK92_10050 [Bacillus swezeyi]
MKRKPFDRQKECGFLRNRTLLKTANPLVLKQDGLSFIQFN